MCVLVHSTAGIADPVKCRVLEIEWRTEQTIPSIDGFFRRTNDATSIITHKMPTTPSMKQPECRK